MSTDRRDFLKFLFGGAAAGATMSPLEILIQSAVNRVQNEAFAQTELNKFYLNISFPGAPDRNTFDLFLDPYGNGQNVIPSLGVATSYGSSSGSNVYDQAIYKTFRVAKHGIHAPWMWGQKMPTTDGFKNIFEIMDHMMLFQGIHSASPGHGMSQMRTEEANNLTVAGLLADSTKTPLNAVQMNSPYTFKSAAGSFITPVTDSITINVIAALMANFNKNRITTYDSLTDNIASSFKNAVDNLNYDSSLRTPNSLNMKNTYDGALDIIKTTVSDLGTVWTTKLNKYKSVTERAALDRANFAGFLDKPIGVANRDARYDIAIATGGNIKCFNPDIRDILYKDSVTSMSACFAVAEFIADNKYAAAINARISPVSTMTQISAISKPGQRAITHDQHNVGTMVRTLTNAVMFRAVSSCLYEMKKFLSTESKGYKFDETVIRLNGEFSRSPRNNGSGADHGWQATTTLLYSGMIQKPEIIGRIYKDGQKAGLHSAGYAGSWGCGAKVNINGINDYILQGNVISSIASMLGIRTPAINNPSLLTVRDSVATLANPEHKLRVV